MKTKDTGQAALILIMIMAVMGAVSVSVASREIESLRSQEIDTVGSQAEGAANAGLELALVSRANIPLTSFSSGNATYQATYTNEGSSGFVTDGVEEGDLVSVSFSGANPGLNGVNVYWNNDAAVFISLLSGNQLTGSYAVDRFSGDANPARQAGNKFSAITSGTYSFKGASFDNRTTIPINLGADPAPKLLRILVLYQRSVIGVEPTGGTLADGQVVTVNSTGTADSNIVTNISLSKFSERVPSVFENVLYTNNNLTQ